jgi:hypothetical protein
LLKMAAKYKLNIYNYQTNNDRETILVSIPI